MKYELWPQILQELENHLSRAVIDRWFNNIIDVDVDRQQSALYLKVHSEGQAEWMESHYLPMLRESILHVTGEQLEPAFSVDNSSMAAAAEPALGFTGGSPADQARGRMGSPAYQRTDSGSAFNPRYNFESFVVGSGNRFAHAAALAVADRPAKNYNPLFIYGGSGLGKTHLMHAIGNRLQQHRPQANILYISTETFTNEFISSVRQGSAHKFKNRYRTADILLIDDIQFLTGKEGTQEEFFHTFNALHEQNKQIVISSDRHPKDIATLEERLRSRFEGGLITDIQPPDVETRIAILQYKASIGNLKITDDAISYIADNIPSNIRELEGALNRVKYYAIINEYPIIDLNMTEMVMADILPNEKRQALSPELIKNAVADYYGIQASDLTSPRRAQKFVRPRYVAMYLISDMLGLSLNENGTHFGNRDHTTVMHGIEKIEKDLQHDLNLQKSVQELKDMLKKR
ncbi:MAG: chromosomal replication initiator protein DnaA [Firmicutes bacterium]|nr:chromosomal replication initiator protein DnaA [Bacillota bacterium]